MRKQYISILESFEPVFITDESAVQNELDHHDELAEAILNFCIEADIIRELVDTSSTEWKVTALRLENFDVIGIGLVLINIKGWKAKLR